MSSSFADTSTAVSGSYTDIMSRLSDFAPRLIVALIVLIVGWLIALIIGNIIATIAQAIGFDALARKIGITRLLDKAGVAKGVSSILGQVVTWILVLVVFMSAAEVLGIQSVQTFLDMILNYIPHVIGATAVVLVGLVFASILSESVRSAAKLSGLNHTEILVSMTRNIIIAFTIIAALAQLRIAADVMKAILYGAIAMTTIAGGIAFGLGGQSAAKRAIEGAEKELTAKK